MSIKEFASLNAGDSIDKVAQIDPVAYYTKRNLELSTVSRETYHFVYGWTAENTICYG